MHRPFRGGITAPAPNNGNLANGQANVDSDASPTNSVPGPGNTQLNGITPLSLSQNDQNAENSWYGLYSFTFTADGGQNAADTEAGRTLFTAEFVADPNTQNRFGYFTDGNPVPLNSPNATAGTASVFVVPAPGAMALLGLGGLIVTRRRRA
jgi:MYXO-CTERM domain-containing protein